MGSAEREQAEGQFQDPTQIQHFEWVMRLFGNFAIPDLVDPNGNLRRLPHVKFGAPPPESADVKGVTTRYEFLQRFYAFEDIVKP
jgi:hypothetical protein